MIGMLMLILSLFFDGLKCDFWEHHTIFFVHFEHACVARSASEVCNSRWKEGVIWCFFLKNCWAYATHRSIPGTNPVRLGLAHNWWTQQRRLSDHSTCWFSNFANKTTFACIFFQRSLVMTIPINSIQVFFLRVDRWGNSDLSSYFLNILCLKTSDNVRLLSVLSAIQRPGCVASQTDASQHQSCRKSSFHYGLRLFLGLSFMSWLGQM